MKMTVCELPDKREDFQIAWEALIVHVREQRSELVLLPELPFSAWFARTPEFDAQLWWSAQHEHDIMMNQLSDFAPAVVLGTHLASKDGKHFNRGFSWASEEGYQSIHDKYYFPDEENFYERCWFDRNERDFTVASVQDMKIGFLICTEVMFNEWARSYGKQGANIIVVPRASSIAYERWIVAPRMAAIASGAFVISSNRVDDHFFIGHGVIIDPDGDVLACTSRQAPFVTVEINLVDSVRARNTYPRDVLE